MTRTRVRRRRIAVVAALVVAVALGAPAVASAFADPSAAAVERTYVVEAGDTLWRVAARMAPQDDPRDVVARLIETNDLQGAAIVPGQVLSLRVG